MDNHVYDWYWHIFDYDAQTGSLYRREVPGRERSAQHAGPITSKTYQGYISLRVDGHTARGHRLVWQMHHREPAPEIIDHINGVRDDNRIENLRAATPHINTTNRRLCLRAHAPYRGVTFDATRGTYRGSIKVDGKTIDLGRHPVAEVIAHRYNKAAVRYHGELAMLNLVGGSHAE